MAAKKSQSEKNATAKAKFDAKGADRIRQIIEATNNKAADNRIEAAKVRSGERSAGNDVYLGDRSAPIGVYSPKKSDYETDKETGVTSFTGPKLSSLIANQGLSTLGGSTEKTSAPAGEDASNQALKDAGKAANAQQLDNFERDTRGNPLTHGLAQIGQWFNAGAGGDLLQDLGQDTGKDQAVKNPTQALLNVASTGLYASARFGEGIGAAVANTNKRLDENPNDVLGAQVQGIGEGVANAFGGIARGVAEGFGARFDGQKPRTWGQNLEAAGSRDLIQGAVLGGARMQGAKGTDEQLLAQPNIQGDINTTQGIAGTVADIAGDPLSFATLGVGAGVKGGFTAAKAASAAARTEGTAARVAAGLKAVPGGFIQGAAGKIAEDAGRKAMIAENRALRRADTPVDVAPEAAVTAGRDTSSAADAVDPTVARTTDVPAVDAPAVDTPTPASPAARTPQQLEQAQTVQGILDRTLTSQPAPVPAKAILEQARSAATTQVDNRIQDVINTAVVAPDSIAASRQALRDLRDTPEGAAVLDRPVTYNGQLVTVEKMAQMTRAAAAMSSPNTNAMLAVLDDAMKGGAAGFDGQKFRQAIAAAGVTVHAAGRDSIPVSEIDNLIVRLQDAGSERAQINMLGRALENTNTRPAGDVGAFIDEAVGGRIDDSTMKEMLTALGVRYQGVRSSGRLQELLNTRGRTEWGKIQDSLLTPEEVVTSHKLPADIVDDAAEFDVSADQKAAVVKAEALGAELLRGDAEYLKAPGTGSISDAVREAAGTLGETVAKKAAAGDVSEFFFYGSKGALSETNRSITQAISRASFTMSGAERAAFAGPRYLAATRLIEAEVRTLGGVTRVLGFEGGGEPLYAGIGELAEAMGDDVFSELMFSPRYLRPTFKQEKLDQFKDGFTLYPNHLLEAAQFSRRPEIRDLAPADRVAAVTEKLRTESKINGYANTAEGQKAVADAGRVLASDEFAAKIDVIQGRNQVRAAAFANDSADNVVAPLAMRLVDAIGRGLDRGAIMQMVKEVSREATIATRNVAGTQDTLVRGLVKQRMDQGVVEGILGQAGMIQVRADKRVAVAAGEGSTRTPSPGSAGDLEQKANVGQAVRDNLDDVDEELTLDVDTILSDGQPMDEDEIAVQMASLVEARTQMTAFGRGFDRAAVALHGPYGMTLDGRTIAQKGRNEVSSATSEFTKNIAHWQHELRTSISTARGGTGTLSYPQVAEAVSDWWTKLARIPDTATSQEATELLIRGMDGVAPVNAAEAELITQFRGLLDEVFSPGPSGLFARSGATAADVLTGQKLYGIVGPRAPFQVRSDIPLQAQTGLWRNVAATGFPADVDPLKLIADMHGAVGNAMVRPRVAGITAKTMDHKAAGFTRQQAFEQGYRTILPNPKRPTSLANYLPRDSMFDQKTRDQLVYLDAFINAGATFKNANLRAVVNTYSQVNYAMKALATVWKPGHHVVSILGGVAANLIGGVGPEQVIRGVRLALLAAKDGGDEGIDVALSALGRDTTLKGTIPEAGRRGPDLLADDVRVIINRGGKKVPVSLTPAQVKRYSEQYGAWISERTEREVLDLTGKPQSKVVAALGAPNRLVGRFSAMRDNVIRMPLMIRVLEGGQYSSLEEAFLKATARVNEIHPTWNTLSNAETKIISKLFFFYTWPKQMASLILREMLDRPGVISAPSKFQYEIAEANGLDPESVGDPWSEENHRDLPTYYTNSPIGPMFQAGMNVDEQGDMPWQFNLQAPQIDSLTFFFQGFEPSYGEPGYTQPVNELRNGLGDFALGNLNPILKAPYELTTLQHLEDSDRPIGNPSTQTTQERQFDWLTGNLGAVNAGSKAFGGTTGGSTYGLDPEDPEDAAQLEQIRKSQQGSAALNFWTGGRFTNLGLPGPLRSGAYQNKEIAEKLGQ